MKIFTLLHNSNIVGTVLPGLKSRITSTRPVLALLLMLMVGGWNSVAWGYSSTKLTVNISGGGKVAVTTSNSAPSSYSSSSVSANQGPHGFWDTYVKDTYYVWVSPNDGYRCTGVSDCSLQSSGAYMISFKGKTATEEKTVTATFVADFYGRADSYSSPSNGGGTYVSCNGNKPSQASQYITHDNSTFSKTGQTSAPACSAYFAALASDGYEFVGWYTGENGTGTKKSANISYTENISIAATSTSSNPTSITRYAYFKPLQYYYFKAQANKVGNGTVYASFTNSSFTSTTDTKSERATKLSQTQSTITPTAYFKAVESDGSYHFAGWYTDAACTEANRVSTDLEYSVVMGNSNKTSEETALTQTLYAKFVQELTPEISATGYVDANPKTMKVGDNIESAFSFLNTSPIGSGLTVISSNTSVLVYDDGLNKISAVGEGTASITFTQSYTGIIKAKTFTFNFSVSRIENNLALTVSKFEMSVDDELEQIINNNHIAIASRNNTDIPVTVTSADPDLIRYDASSDKIIVPNDNKDVFVSKEVNLVFSQPQTYKYTAASETIVMTVKKHVPTFTLSDNELVIDETATLTLTDVDGASVSVEQKGSIISYVNGTVTALAAGKAKLTVTQPETRTHAYKQQEFEVSVIKKTPSLTVQLNGSSRTSLSLSYNATATFGYANKMSDAEVEVKQVDGTAYVTYANGTFTTYYGAGTAHYKAVLPETDTYQRGEFPFSITVNTPNGYLPVSGKSYTIGSGSATDWTHRYETLHFNGIPDKLTFNYAYIFDVEEFSIPFVGTVNIGNPTRRFDDLSDFAKKILNLVGNYSDTQKGVGNEHFIYVEESADGSNWKLIWADDSPVDKKTYPSGEIQLSETTRYIRFHHASNFSNSYTNISITEKKYVEDPVPNSIDFGTSAINAGVVKATTYINWCNVAPMTVTCSNPRFTVTPNTTFGNYLLYGRQTLTISYTHGPEVGAHEGDITITNGVYTKTIHVSAETTKYPQEIIWNDQIVATGFAMNVGESYPDETIGYIAAVAREDAVVTFTSANSDIIAVENGKLVAKAVGSVEITAHQAGDEEFQETSSTQTFVVTNLQKQTITWDQNLLTLLTTSGTVELTATASSGGAITYASADESIVKVEGNVLTVVGEGETTITATQAGGNIDGVDYLAISQSKSVIVRNPEKTCNGVALSEPSLDLSRGSQAYRLAGMPDSVLSFTARHDERTGSIWGGGVNYSELVVEQYACIDGNWGWYEVFKQVVSTSNTSYSTSKIDETAEQIRFSTAEAATHHITSIRIANKKFMRTDAEAVDMEIEANAIWSKKITVSHSNIDYMTITSKKGLIELSTTTLGEGCGDFGDDDFTAKFTPLMKYTHYYDTIVITDSKAQPTTIKIPVHFYTKGLNQSILGFEVPETCVSTDLLEPFSATASTELPVAYHSSDSTIAYVDAQNRLYILSSGTVSITARQDGDNKYDKAEQTKSIVITKATPAIATVPTSEAIQYLQTLENSTIANDGKATVTLRGVENTKVEGTWAWSNPTQVIKDSAGTHEYQVTFTPTDGGMYTTNTCMLPVTILRAPQAIAMNNGTVRVAVDGIDAGASDSKLDLDSLIASQTSDVVNSVKRDGVVTYTVISDNKDNATIDANNIFSATKIGEYTIRATKAETKYYNTITADFKVTVSKRANTLTIAGTEYEKFVDDVITDICSTKNSDATVQTSSTYPTVARYDVESNKIVIPNSESDVQMFGEYIMDTIKIWQEATERFEACEKTIIVTVKKYVTASNGEDYIIKVNETKTANYGFVNTSASYPSNNNEDDFYYTIDKPNFENEALNNGTELITYNPATNQITGHNAGTTKITFFQKETYKYTGATLMCNIAVEKRSNQISNSWNNIWQKAMSKNGTASISFTSTHGDYANYPIVIEQIYGNDVATLTGTASGASIATNTTDGYAIWHLSQAENYEYYAAEADVMVMVGVQAPPTCYVYEDNSEHKFSTSITDAEGHYETPIAIDSPIDKIWFKAKRQVAGFNYFAVQYSTDDAKTWSTVISPDLGTDYAEYSASFPTISGNKRITHVRFGAKTGATLSKWYKDVKISRRAYLNILDAEKKKISKLPTMTCTVDTASTAEAKFYIDYSTCADKIYIESSDTVHFTVSRSEITANGDNLTSAKEEITVTYSSTELGEHNAVITIRTSYQTCALSVSGKTEKRTPTITWQENFTNNPLTLPVGLTVNATKPAATTTSTALIKYESSDEKVIEIIEEGYAFKVVGKGTATLTAIVPENEVWKSTSDSREINATDKVVQEIVWGQTFPRFMEPGDVIDLDAKVFLRNLSTDALTYSEERTQYITYLCPLNNGIVSINGNKMTVLNYGEVKVTASVGGNADYEAASMTVLITVRKPSVGCETPLVFHKEEAIDMFEVNIDFSNYANLTTQEMISGEIKIDHSNGKPDKLSFQYEGEEFKIGLLKYFGGFVKFEQRVNLQWIPVEGSRVETVKNEWNAKSGLQLDENADALRIIRESGATGHHYIKDIQVTRKQYLRATQNEINLGEITMGQATPVTIGFEYSDVKGDLTARTINNTTDVTIKNNGAIDIECGSLGHYDLPVTFTPSQVGDWEGTIEVYDNIANLSITIHLTATVKANEEYIFNQEGDWNTSTNWTTNLVPDENADITVAKDMVINSSASVKSITIEEGVTVTVKSGMTLVIGDGSPKNRETYGNLYVEDRGQVILNGGELRINDFKLDASLGSATEDTNTPASSGQVSGESNLRVDGDAYFQVSFDPAGAITFGWYDFTVPFEVDALNGVFDKDGNKLTYNVDYAIMEYSEAKRAAKAARAWTWFSGTLQPGKLYTITFDDEKNWNTFIFKKKPHVLYTETKTFAAVCSPSGDAQDRGWNGMGNGSLQHRQLDLPGDAKIQIEDHANKCYVVRDAADYTYAVGTAFFVQVGEPKNIDLIAATGDRGFLAPARNGRSVNEFRLAFAADGQEMKADRIWVSASEEATGEYVIGHDLLKMGTPTEAKVAQVWATRDNMTLCDIEMPLVANKAATAISLFAPSAGIYTLSTEKMPEDATLYLTKNGKVIWNLSMSPYEFDLTQGTTEGYGLRIVANSNSATGIEGADSEGETIRKVLIDDMIYIIAPNGSMYNVTGKIVK